MFICSLLFYIFTFLSHGISILIPQKHKRFQTENVLRMIRPFVNSHIAKSKKVGTYIPPKKKRNTAQIRALTF